MAATEIAHIIDRLLRFRSAGDVPTQDFRSVKHNAYHCPIVEKQLKRIVDSFEKYQKVVYDVQGIHDRGTDILVRMPFADEGVSGARHKYICLQLKSFDDLEEARYLQTIKAQWAETLADRKDDLEHYYLLLCTDATVHKSKIREINGFFANTLKATVISPGECWTFQRLGESWIAAVIESVLREGDAVRRKARDCILDLSPQETAIMVLALCGEIESGGRVKVENVKNTSFLGKLYRRVPDYPRDYFVGSDGDCDVDESDDTDLDNDERSEEDNHLISSPVDQRRPPDVRLAQDLEAMPLSISAAGEIQFDAEVVRPIQALILDAIVRYNLAGDRLVQHVVATLQIDRPLEFEALDE